MKFEKGYKLGWDLEKVEDLKDKVLNYYGLHSEDNIYNENIKDKGDGWYYYYFEIDTKIINLEQGKIVIDYKNKLLFVNDKKLKIEENTDFAIKTLKTKIKTTTVQELTSILIGEYDDYRASRLFKIYK